MSKIETKIVRSNGRNILKIHIHSPDVLYSNMNVQFLDKNSNSVYIISSSVGSIRDNVVYINKKTDYIEICILPETDKINCILSCFNPDLVHHESLEFSTNLKEIENLKIQKYNENKFDSISNSFIKDIKNKSKWRIQIKVENNNVMIRVLQAGNHATKMCFGKNTDVIKSNDIIFTVYPDTSYFYIPNNILWKFLEGVKENDIFSCFELTKSSFHSAEIYYKIVVSNSIKADALPRKL